MTLRLPRRAGRRTNLGLLVLLVTAFVTGALAYGTGSPAPATVVVALHGAAGLGLLLLVPWKAVVVRRSWPRSATRTTSALLGGLVALAVAAGVLHAVGVAPIVTLWIHVAAAICAAPLLAAHMWGRRQRPRRTDLSRRTLIQLGGLAAGAAALWGATEGALKLTGAPGAERRGTGSLEIGTDQPAAMPVTQWFTDTVPQDDAGALTLVAGGTETRIAVRELDRGDEVRAALDCTGGWYAVQTWSGVRLDRLLADMNLPADGSVDVVSRTGYRRRLPLRDARHLLLATSAAGRPLSTGHGAPVRLVAPGRRGFWWVKWVERIEVVDAPWWAQPPFPLQ